MSRLPAAYRPQLATLVKAPPEGGQWVHEIKYDGFRIGCRIDRGAVKLLSRNGLDWTSRFPEVSAAAGTLPVRTALLDGEVAVLEPGGRTSFQALQNLGPGRRSNLVFFVFDLLFLNGRDLAGTPLLDRKQSLATLLGASDNGEVLRYSEHFEDAGMVVLERACRLGLEGIVSKRIDEPYRPGRHGSWLKSKCVNRQEFVIGGFTEPEGRRRGIGALLIGYFDERQRLTFAGKVGTGFTDSVSRQLRDRLESRRQDASPFDAGPKGRLARNAHWVEPDLVCEVTFTEWTADGKVRHPSFQGLRDDKPPRDVRRERARPGSRASSSPAESTTADVSRSGARASDTRGDEVATVRLSHPDRVVFSDLGTTKRDLARFYARVAEWMLPHLRGRPLTLVRCPDGAGGGCFFMKHSKAWAPGAVRRVSIQEKKKVGEYLIVDDVAALIGLVQMNVLEIHTWNSREDHIEEPDRLVFDIDPGPDVDWRAVTDAARLVRSMLESLELASFVKTTGSRGLHVVVPLQPHAGWQDCMDFARTLAEAIARSDPDRYTTAFAKAGRERKILIDYLRNNRTNTSIAAFSTRARPSGSVSVPLRWDELTSRMRSDHFTVANLPPRLDRLSRDPWSDYWTSRQRLTISVRKAMSRR